ncbi:MAG: response regulator [Bacteroidales bacterium]
MKKKILLIDDIREFRTMMRIILSGIYEVVTAEDGEDALKKMEEGFHPDAIVTDLVMPRMDGYQLISEVRKRGSHSNIPIIVLSGVDRMTRQRKLREKEICGYIVKPMHAGSLRKKLIHSLDSALVNPN